MAIRVLVAADIDRAFHESIGGDTRFDVTVRPIEEEEALAAAVGDYEVLVTRYHTRLSRLVINAADKLRIIAQGTSGLDNIDLEMAATRGIKVISLPGLNANAVAELVIGHMIHLTRTVGAYSRSMREGEWNRADCATRHELRGHRLGIVGLGRVGSVVARLAAGFGVNPIAYDPYLEDRDFVERGAERVMTLEDLLERSDIVTFHVPLTSDTKSMLGKREIDLLATGSFVINTSRGPVVDVPSLLHALSRDRLGGVALDVFDEEPPVGGDWPDDPRLILTPHIAGCTTEAKASIGRLLYEKICEAISD